MKRLLFIFLLSFIFFAQAQTEKQFDISSIKVDDDICIKNLLLQPVNVRITADVKKMSNILVTNINMEPSSQVNYITSISDNSRKIKSINVFTDKKTEIKVYGYDDNLIIEISDAVEDYLESDKKNAVILNEENILDYWYEDGKSKYKRFRDKVYVTNYSNDDNIVLTIYGCTSKAPEQKIGTVAINSKYETKQVYLYVDKISRFDSFIIVPSNDKKYKFYGSVNHGDMYIFFENEVSVD